MQNPALYQQLSKFYGGVAGATPQTQKEIDAYAKAQGSGSPLLYAAIDEMINSPSFTISKATADKLVKAGLNQDFMLIRKDFLAGAPGAGVGTTTP